MGVLRLGRRVALGLVLVVMLVTTSGQAAPQRIAACPAPKPLPEGVKKPPKGANATQFANFLLALPQRKPCDVSLFTSKYSNGTPGFYPEGSPMQPAAGSAPSEAAIRSQLASFFGGSPSKAAALALFARADLRAKLPDPTLRAALVSLKGTVAEPVIDWLLTKSVFVEVRFGGTPLGYIATVSGSGTSQRMLFSRTYAGEHFALLSAMFAHEILHHDDKVTATEEVLLHALNELVHMQLLDRHPELGTQGTELARYMNTEVLLFVNSRAPGSPKSSIIAPTGKGTAPGSAKSKRDLWEHAKDFHLLGNAAKPSDSSPAPPVLATVLRKLLAPGVAIAKPLTYSNKTALLFSKMNDTWLSPVDRLRISVLLGLVSIDEIVRYTGLTRAKAIATFRLAPILALK